MTEIISILKLIEIYVSTISLTLNTFRVSELLGLWNNSAQ
jgi:hypothetical protein